MQSQRTWGYHHLHFWGIQRERGEKEREQVNEFYLFFRPISEAHTYPDVLWLPGWCRPSAHASLGYALSVCLPSSHSSHISLPRTRWWQAFQTAGNGLALKWNWSLWNCLESWLIWGEGKKRGREREIGRDDDPAHLGGWIKLGKKRKEQCWGSSWTGRQHREAWRPNSPFQYLRNMKSPRCHAASNHASWFFRKVDFCGGLEQH